MFVEGSEVSYKGMCGVVKFVCSSYIVISLPVPAGRNSPHLIVFPEYYKEVTSFKDSDK
jgi:hypothetical protein